MKTRLRDAGTLRLHFLFLWLICFTLVMAWGLAQWHALHVVTPQFDASLLIAEARSNIRPKPTEQFVFLTLALVIPIVIFIAGLRYFRDLEAGRHPWAVPVPVTCTLLVLVLPFFSWDPGSPLVGATALMGHDVQLYAIVLAVAGLWCWYSVRALSTGARRAGKLPSKVLSGLGWALAAGISVVQAGAWRTASLDDVNLRFRWTVHADAVVYSVSQVMQGKTLLVDLPSQYGLFAHFLQPFLHLGGASVLAVISVFALMQVGSMVAVYAALQSGVKDGLHRVAGILALLAVTYGTLLFLNGMDEPYFQYWPIRFFWPALSVLACCRFAVKPTLARSCAVSLVATLGALWNMDTGLVIFIAYAGMLCANYVALLLSGRLASSGRRRLLAKAIALHIGVLAAGVGIAIAGLSLRSGFVPDWTWVFGYQKVFYGIGFAMLPLPLVVHPWMSVVCVYMLSLLVAMRIWATSPGSRTACVMAFVSLLGLGLFVYYEGRSHDLNLLSVSWPAIFLTALLSDRCLRGVRVGLLSRLHLAHNLGALCVLLLLSLGVVSGLELFASRATRIALTSHAADSRVSEEIAFIRKNTRPGEACAILSLRQGIYHLESGTSSPLKGPGYAETLLQSDMQAVTQQVLDQRPGCVFLGLLPGSKMPNLLNVDAIERAYVRTETSPSGAIALLRPKS